MNYLSDQRNWWPLIEIGCWTKWTIYLIQLDSYSFVPLTELLRRQKQEQVECTWLNSSSGKIRGRKYAYSIHGIEFSAHMWRTVMQSEDNCLENRNFLPLLSSSISQWCLSVGVKERPFQRWSHNYDTASLQWDATIMAQPPFLSTFKRY